MKRVGTLLVALTLSVAAALQAQPVPQPFPRPPGSTPSDAQPPRPPSATPPPPASAPAAANSATPSDAELGVAIYPGAQFIGSFDAGQGQRYYLFGANAPYADIVAYYRTILKMRGEVVFDEPPVYIFETGRFREESMAFPPSVAVKDYTWGGQQGYLVPLPAGKSLRFPTVIQVVPVTEPPSR